MIYQAGGPKEVKIQLADRALLSLQAANHLAILLTNVFKGYEPCFGQLDIGQNELQLRVLNNFCPGL